MSNTDTTIKNAATALVDSWLALWNGDYDIADRSSRRTTGCTPR